MSDRLGRRELLVGAGVLGYGALAAYLWTGVEPERGRIVARELTADDRTLLYEDEDDSSVDGLFSELEYDDPSTVLVSEHLSWLHAEHDGLSYRLCIEADGDEAWFTTDQGVFDTVGVDQYVTYQLSLREPGHVQSISCLASTEATLESRCAYDEVDPVE